MPEILEVELFRRSAEVVVGRRVRRVEDDDPIVCVDHGSMSALTGARVNRVSRHGKVMTLWFSGGLAVDVHFGMSGRLVVDGSSAIDALVYGASDNDRWSRFRLDFGRGYLALSDPRRFGRVSWHDENPHLGPDAFDVERSQLVDLLETRRAPVKAVLLDQSAVAGLGNMLVDEILWRSRISPHRPAGDLTSVEATRVHREIGRVLADLMAAGGSHAGKLSADLRVPGSVCPRDGAVLVRTVCGGRTTYACPVHQV